MASRDFNPQRPPASRQHVPHPGGDWDRLGADLSRGGNTGDPQRVRSTDDRDAHQPSWTDGRDGTDGQDPPAR